MKRTIDIIVSFLGLIITFPLDLVIYLAIKIEDGGKAIYSQKRIGFRSRPFTIYKFRSMTSEAEKDGPHLCVREDSRVTRVGGFIRLYHLDELPQLWNVLAGDLSLVGPRPERRCFIDKIMEIDCRYSRLFSVRPGLFSMATLYNGYTDTMAKMLRRLEMDLEYLEHHSVFVDIKILFLSLCFLLSGKRF